MDQTIHITRVPHYSCPHVFDDRLISHLEKIGFTPDELFASGFDMLTERFKDSDYGDISAPAALEFKTPPANPIVGIFATRGNEVLGQMCIYNAHLPVPVEDDFGEIFSVFRIKERRKIMIHFGALASDKDMIHSPRVIGRMLKEGFNFAIEQNFSRAFACVHPKHVPFYREIIGCRVLGEVDNVTGLENAPGVLLYATPDTMKVENLRRL